MKIAVSSLGNDLNAQVDPRFGRCQFFLIVDAETLEFKALSNESAMASGGAGIQAAETVSREGVEVMITGNVGPNAYRTLNAAGIKIATGAGGITVKEALEKFKRGELGETASATVDSHAGMGGGGGQGSGMGRGRGV